MSKALAKRLDALEVVHEPQVIGVTGIWETPGMVSLCGTHEEILREDWDRRYPDGMLITVKYDDDWSPDDAIPR